MLNQLHIDFRALSGVMAAGSRQIFANEVTTGAKNVGVVLFSIQDPANIFNVLSSAGNSRSIYPVMTSALNNCHGNFMPECKNRSRAGCHIWPGDESYIS